jgi:hypothetical protein
MVGYLAVAHGSWKGVEVGWCFSFYLFKGFSGVYGSAVLSE